jgi:hypothetical protein
MQEVRERLFGESISGTMGHILEAITTDICETQHDDWAAKRDGQARLKSSYVIVPRGACGDGGCACYHDDADGRQPVPEVVRGGAGRRLERAGK